MKLLGGGAQNAVYSLHQFVPPAGLPGKLLLAGSGQSVEAGFAIVL
jgi:hypothetical protein